MTTALKSLEQQIQSDMPEQFVVQQIGDCPCHFPDSIAFGCAMELLGLIRGDNFSVTKAMQHAACLLGSVANQFGDGDRPQPVGTTTPVGSLPVWLIPLVMQFISRLMTEQKSS